MDKPDRLLQITRILLWGIFVFLAGGMLFSLCSLVAITMGWLPVYDGPAPAYLGEANEAQLLHYLWQVLPVALMAAICAMAFIIMLLKLIRSVARGNPFILANAERLKWMGWAAIGFQALAIIVTWLEYSFFLNIAKTAPIFDLDVAGFVVGLVLFILARIFRLGVDMHNDLEGTV